MNALITTYFLRLTVILLTVLVASCASTNFCEMREHKHELEVHVEFQNGDKKVMFFTWMLRNEPNKKRERYWIRDYLNNGKTQNYLRIGRRGNYKRYYGIRMYHIKNYTVSCISNCDECRKFQEEQSNDSWCGC